MVLQRIRRKGDPNDGHSCPVFKVLFNTWHLWKRLNFNPAWIHRVMIFGALKVNLDISLLMWEALLVLTESCRYMTRMTENLQRQPPLKYAKECSALRQKLKRSETLEWIRENVFLYPSKGGDRRLACISKKSMLLWESKYIVIKI